MSTAVTTWAIATKELLVKGRPMVGEGKDSGLQGLSSLIKDVESSLPNAASNSENTSVGNAPPNSQNQHNFLKDHRDRSFLQGNLRTTAVERHGRKFWLAC